MASVHSLQGIVLRTESAGSGLSKNSETSGFENRSSQPNYPVLSPAQQVELDHVPKAPAYAPLVGKKGLHGMIGRSSKVHAAESSAPKETDSSIDQHSSKMAEPLPNEIGMSSLSLRQEVTQTTETSDTLARTLHQVIQLSNVLGSLRKGRQLSWFMFLKHFYL